MIPTLGLNGLLWIGGKLLMYSKLIIGNGIDYELVGWTPKDFGPNEAYSSSHSSPTKVKGTKEPNVCKQIFNKPLSRLRNKTHWNQTLYPQWSHHCGCNGRVVRLNRVHRRGEEKLELPPKLGLGTIYIALLRGRTNLTTRVWVRSLGMAWEGARHPKPPTRGSVSTHCILRLNFVKGKFNIHHSKLTHLLTCI